VANRDRHRQGLVYGPVRPTGPRDRGRIVGNLLGLLFVVATIGFLAVAIYFFIQARAAEPPPPLATPTPVVTSEPSPSPSATPSSSATNVAVTSAPATVGPSEPAVTATPLPLTTPGPTIFVPQVLVGPGFVTFGTNADDQLRITDAKSTFGLDEPMVWSAYLTEAANSSDLRIRILKLDASQPSGQALIREDEVKPDATGAQIFFRRLRPLGTTYGPGLYTIEYVRGDQILSTGSFLVQ
jgi:hypothetical protein